MTSSLGQLASALIETLEKMGFPADRFPTGADSEGVNVWAPAAAVTETDPTINRYPQVSVVLAEHGRFSGYSWGRHFEHLVEISTATDLVAQQIVQTLPGPVREAADS